MRPKRFCHKIVVTVISGIIFLKCSCAFSQNKPDTIVPTIGNSDEIEKIIGKMGCPSAPVMNKKRFGLVTAVHAVGYGASIYGLSAVWYKNYAQTKFHFFNDVAEWGGMDKLGHITTAWQIANFSYRLYRYTNMRNERAALVGSSVALFYQTTLEFFDGFSSGWGFSWGDMGANLVGCTFAYFRNTGYLKNVHYKFSWHQTNYPQYRTDLLGKTIPEQILKDYNGQTYWLSFNAPAKWFRANHNWLCFAVGYSIDGFTGARQNVFDPSLKNPPVFNRTSEMFLSLDIDFEKFDIKNKFLKTVLKVFNVLKIPFPAIGFNTGGKLLMKPFYF